MTMTKTFDCVECGASAPYGRLSCPSCGALLASVTGGRRSAVRVAQVEAEPESPVAAAAPVASLAPADAPAAGTNGAKAAAQRKRAPAPFLDAAEPPAPAPSPVATPAPAPKATTTTDARPPAAAQAPKPAPNRRRRAPSRPRPPRLRQSRPRRGPEPNPELRPDASRSGAERRLDPGTDPGSRRRGGSRPRPGPRRRGQGRADARSVEAATDGRHRPRSRRRSPPRWGRPAGPRATRRPRPRPLRARTSAPATPAKSQTARSEAERVEAERAAIVPLLEPSAIASLPATPWAPLEEPAPALIGSSVSAPPGLRARSRRQPAHRRAPTDRPPRRCSWRHATAAANDAARAHPAPDVSGAGGAEATMTRDSTWWLNTVPDPARFVEIAGWFIVVGAAMSLLGFLLPWSRVVIGARTNGGYFDGWGLGQPDPPVRLRRPARRSSPWPSAAGPSRPGSRRGSWVSSSAACCSALPGRTWSARSVPTSV